MSAEKTFHLGLDNLESLQEEAQMFFEDAEEIGSSDINCFIHGFLKQYDVTSDDVADSQWRLMQMVTRNSLKEDTI